MKKVNVKCLTVLLLIVSVAAFFAAVTEHSNHVCKWCVDLLIADGAPSTDLDGLFFFYLNFFKSLVSNEAIIHALRDPYLGNKLVHFQEEAFFLF